MPAEITETDLVANWESIQHRVAAACTRAGRSPDEITVVAVTKTHPIAYTRKAYALGLRHFGENRIQETVEKYSKSGISNELSDLNLHLVGHLQRNKVRKALQIFDTIDSLDTVNLAQSLDLAAVTTGRKPRVLLEVNTSLEPQKYGVAPDSTLHLASMVMGCRNLDLAGLMTVGPQTDDSRAIRQSFQSLRGLFDAIRDRLKPPAWSVLSMGMSGDFEMAIEEGATEVRLGTVLFGLRSTT